jgi:hypothetical protein
VSTAVGDAAEFLDVNVDQIPGMRVLVAADHPPGATIQPGQFRQPVADSTRCTVDGWMPSR